MLSGVLSGLLSGLLSGGTESLAGTPQHPRQTKYKVVASGVVERPSRLFRTFHLVSFILALLCLSAPASAQTDTPPAAGEGAQAPATGDAPAADEGEAGAAEGAEVAQPSVPPLSESLTGMARAEYEAGKILYADGDFKGAALKFQTAYDASKDARLLWNIAAAEKNQRHYVAVIELVKRYMSEAANMISPQEFADAEALIKTVQDFVGDVTFNVNEPGAEIFVDDVSIGKSPLPGAVQLDMGSRKIRVTKQGFLPFETTWNVPGGSPSSMDVALEKEIHQGRLRLVATKGDTIRVDGKVMGDGQWEGVLPSGIHSIEVTAPGRRTYTSDVAVRDNELTTLRITLENDQVATPAGGGGSGWMWLAGGAVVAGLGVGAYYLFRPEESQPPPYVEGSLEPGIITF